MATRRASVSLSRLKPGTTTLRTLINVGELGPTEQRWPIDETYNLQNYGDLREILSDPRTWRQIWTVRSDDPQADTTELALLAELGKQAATTAALVVNNALWGELYVTYSRADEANGADVRAYLEVYLAIVESALARAAQIQSLEQLAYEDPLTGLANRRALDEAAADLTVGAGASCGIATGDGTQGDSSVSDVFRRADAALYRSKQAGRLVTLKASVLAEPPVDQSAMGHEASSTSEHPVSG